MKKQNASPSDERDAKQRFIEEDWFVVIPHDRKIPQSNMPKRGELLDEKNASDILQNTNRPRRST